MSQRTDVVAYEGAAMTVTWDSRLCIHVGECTRAKRDLFVSGRDPWCTPDAVPAEDAAEVVRRCPTGALAYTPKDGSASETPPAENVVVVTYDGPLFVRGDLAIEGVAGDMPGVRFRAALCRCGQSARKPFCDNTHEQTGFRDHGAVGDRGDALVERGGTLEIRPLENGPLLVTGNLTIVASSGRAAWHGAKTALCRCGQSGNKPFCDGTHRTVGFQST